MIIKNRVKARVAESQVCLRCKMKRDIRLRRNITEKFDFEKINKLDNKQF